MKKIITICGPTGIGKTSLAIALAKRFDGEIIGADSMQIYKYMDVGTAKPDPRERAMARHHMVDFLDPKESFDAGQYTSMADRVIEDIIHRGKLPIVAGGTGLYIRALIHGLFRAKPVCEQTLAQLNAALAQDGSDRLHKRLQSLDPEAAKKIHPHDGFRIVRALEVFQTSGIPISETQKAHDFNELRYDSLTLGLRMDRSVLYERIDRRVDIMMNQGLLSEVRDLVERGYSLDLKSMQSIGYRHMGLFLRGEADMDEAIRLLKRDTRRYAKRQFTWFGKERDLIWVDSKDTETVIGLAEDFLT